MAFSIKKVKDYYTLTVTQLMVLELYDLASILVMQEINYLRLYEIKGFIHGLV